MAILDFLEDLEDSIFAPSKSGFIPDFTLHSFITGCVIGFIGLILYFIGWKGAINPVSCIIGFFYFAFMLLKLYPCVLSVDGNIKRIGYAITAIALGAFTFSLGIYISILGIFIVIAYYVFKFIINPNSNKEKYVAEIEYEDGTKETAEEEGRDILGARIYKTKDGDTIIKS